MVCDTRSPVADLFNRFTVQTQLWTSVLSIRNGQYYGNGFRDFINGVDMCKLNGVDETFKTVLALRGNWQKLQKHQLKD